MMSQCGVGQSRPLGRAAFMGRLFIRHDNGRAYTLKKMSFPVSAQVLHALLQFTCAPMTQEPGAATSSILDQKRRGRCVIALPSAPAEETLHAAQRHGDNGKPVRRMMIFDAGFGIDVAVIG